MMRLRAILLGSAVLTLAACDQMDGLFGKPEAPAPEPVPVVTETSPESEALRAFYARVEQGHRTRGLLRIDGGGPDVPYDADRLARTFEAVAFSQEFSAVGTRLVRQETESILHRWVDPVRFEVIFGASVSDAQRADDLAAVQRFSARLGRVADHPVSLVAQDGNFRVLILSEDERRVSGPLLKRLLPSVRDREVSVIENLDRESYCVVIAADAGGTGVLKQAVAVIRAELPPLLRLSCVHEELAQGMGLTNDSPTARPSIFNDDDEFGRLTSMDEAMLGMLYDPRLSPGMDADTARPIVRALAEAQFSTSF